jgi:hypothetical protein
MCEGYRTISSFIFWQIPSSAELMKVLLVQQIYAWGKAPATRNDWFAEFRNPKSINWRE